MSSAMAPSSPFLSVCLSISYILFNHIIKIDMKRCSQPSGDRFTVRLIDIHLPSKLQ